MGYSVKIYPPNGRSGLLKRGGLAPAWSVGTYYDHPSGARKAAKSWVAKHPEGRAEIIRFMTRDLVENILP